MTQPNQFTPAVLCPLTLPALLNHVVSTQSTTASTTLIVCSSRETFIQSLFRSLQQQENEEGGSLEKLITPTLHNLFTTKNINLAFCDSLQNLLAFLSAYKGQVSLDDAVKPSEQMERAILVNPLALHALTPSFSAQGLSRTFAATIDMAVRIKAKLVVVECLGARSGVTGEEEDADLAMIEGGEAEDGRFPGEEDNDDPWDQEVPILNVSAKRFGSGSAERSWAGRTVKVKRVAGRWCRFQRIDARDMQR